MNEPTDNREFLLRSLEDLEREHAAGDLSDEDYRTLADDYTARAAAALRAELPSPPTPARRSRGRGAAVLLGVLAVAAIAGVLVAQSSGRRAPGAGATGGTRQSITEKLNEAQRLFADRDGEGAIEAFDEVLEDEPTNAEALTYKGWAQYVLLDEPSDGLLTLIDAATANRDYPDVHAFLAYVWLQRGQPETALLELDLLDSLDPPSDIRSFAAGLRAEVETALASASTTTTTT